MSGALSSGESSAAFLGAITGSMPRLRRLCVPYCTDPADREDLLQEILVNAWRARESFRGEAQFSTWLYRVALNTALQHLRARRRRPHIVSDVVAERSASAAFADVRRLDLASAIGRLPPVDRAIIVMHLEDAPYEEIGAVIGLQTGAVGARLTRIRERLRAMMTGRD